MSSVPKIATTPAVNDLITTRQLRGAYKRASEPSLRETASRPLFEEFLNEYLRCSTLSVFGEQQLDQSHQAVDISVGYYDDEPLPNMVFVLLVECKRHRVSSRGELESQLQEYADRYLDTKHQGLAKNPVVYGATAYGTKIRFFQFSRESGHFEDRTFSGDLHVPKEEFYWDLKTDGKKIHGVLKEIWAFRLRLDQTPHTLPTRPAIRGPDGGKGAGISASTRCEPNLANMQPKPAGEDRPVSGSQSGKMRSDEYTDVGEMSVEGKFYSFRLNGKLIMKYQSDWRSEGGILFHDNAKYRGTLRAETLTGHQSTANDYTDVGKLEMYQVFYSFDLNGQLTMKFQDEWREEGGYFYHDGEKLRGFL